MWSSFYFPYLEYHAWCLGIQSFSKHGYACCLQTLALHYMSRNVRKHTFWDVQPKLTQISLRISAVWSDSSLSAWRSVASVVIQNVPSEDSDLTVWMRRLIWIFAGHTSEGTFSDVAVNISFKLQTLSKKLTLVILNKLKSHAHF